MTKRILYVLPEFPPAFGGGISTVYGNLLPCLVKAGYYITVVLANLDQLDHPRYFWKGVEVQPLQSWSLARGLEIAEAWKFNSFLFCFLPSAWAAWIQGETLGSFDLIEVTDWALLFIPWLIQKRNQPIVVSLHGSCGQVDWHENTKNQNEEGQLVRILESSILPLADRLISNSKINADFWFQQCGIKPTIIPPIMPKSIHEINIQHRSKRGLVVARLQNWKGPDILCKALRLLPNQYIDWIGEDTFWEQSSIKASAHLRQNFPDIVGSQLNLLGKVPPDEVKAHISSAAFLCVPSIWDVFNITVLEAIAAGTPVVCSSCAGAEMLIHHGRTGFLFDPRQPEELAQAISCVVSLKKADRMQITMQALHHISSLTNSSLITCHHQALYDKIVYNFEYREQSLWLENIVLHGMKTCTNYRARRESRSVCRFLRLGLHKLHVGLRREKV